MQVAWALVMCSARAELVDRAQRRNTTEPSGKKNSWGGRAADAGTLGRRLVARCCGLMEREDERMQGSLCGVLREKNTREKKKGSGDGLLTQDGEELGLY